MNAQSFLENFGHIANAPDGVNRLRFLILQLGVQGKLVEQRFEDIPALDWIRKSDNPIVEISPNSSIQAPSGWVSITLGSVIASNVGGGTPSKNNPNYWNGNIHWASVKDVQNHKFIDSTIDKITEEGLQNSSANLIPPFRLIVVTRMGLGKLAINKIPLAINQDLRAIQPTEALDLNFAYLLFKSLNFVGKGVTVKGITINELHAALVQIPPLEEQKRIVAKVDELMALCDKLEAQQQEREKRLPVLSRACHARFAESPTSVNLAAIFEETETVSPKDLRNTILTLATQGRLVQQDANGESSSELLDRIKSERDKAAKARQVSRMRPLPSADTKELHYPLRPGWTIARTYEALLGIQTGPFGSSLHKSDYRIGGTPVVNPASLKSGKIVPIPGMAVDGATLARLSIFKLNAGDVVLARRGEMGRCAVVTSREHGWLCGTGCLILRLSNSFDSSFLALLLGSPSVREYLGGASIGTTMKNLNQSILSRMPIGVPPLQEQHRIVAKVAHLMAIVDRLESQQIKKNKIAKAFAQAAVTAITGTEIREPEKMKAPKTELVSRLQAGSKPKAADQAPLAGLLAKHKGELPAKTLWQQSGLEIDAFYQQLRTEMASGWILEPEKAVMQEVEAD